MIDYLPPVLKDVREMRAVLDKAGQPAFESLWGAMDAAFLDQHVRDATVYGVERWERMLKIRPKANESLDERKFRILTRLNESLPYTMRTLRATLAALCGENGYIAELFASEYRLMVRVALAFRSTYESVETLLGRIVPCEIVIDLSLMYNQHDLLKRYTHRQLAAYTHYALRNEVISGA